MTPPNTDRTELAVSLEHNSGGVLVMRLVPRFPVATEIRVDGANEVK